MDIDNLRKGFYAFTSRIPSISCSKCVLFCWYLKFLRAAARQVLTQDDLLKFESIGQVLLHITDMHGQLNPVYFRPPSENYGVGAFEGVPPHLIGAEFLNI